MKFDISDILQLPIYLGSADSPPAGTHPGAPIDMSCKMVAVALPIGVPHLPQPLVETLLVDWPPQMVASRIMGNLPRDAPSPHICNKPPESRWLVWVWILASAPNHA